MNNPHEMIRVIRDVYGFDSPDVLNVMADIPREEFVSKGYKNLAYSDAALSIGYGQTISQPYTVAFMTNLVKGTKKSKRGKVLEIGTGSGYQAAVLSRFFDKVYTIEIIPQLAKRARKIFKKIGYKNIYVKIGTGEFGWREKGMFDAIVVTAGLFGEVPRELFDQLGGGGVLVAPIGEGKDKIMTRFIRNKDSIKKEEFGIFHFVPFIEAS